MRFICSLLVLASLALGRDIVFGPKGSELPGTLTMPGGRERHPALVLVQGSGPSDRDETIGENKPFRDIAEGLASRGIAVLRYDKRTRVYGAGGIQTVADEVINDACQAVRFAQSQPDIDPARVFLLGHSFGGYLMPRMVEQCENVAGAIIAAGSVRNLLDLARDQVVSQNPLSDPKPVLERIRKAAPGSYWDDLETYQPGIIAARQHGPLLILQGERDANVPLSELDRWRKALALRKDVKYKTYPKLNHLFMPGEGEPDLSEAVNLVGHVSRVVVDDIAAFIRPESVAEASRSIRVGIIGTDTSHVPAFTRVLNDEKAPEKIPGLHVVAAFKGGSPDVANSKARVDQFAKDIYDKYEVEIVPDIPTLLSKVDAVLLESLDGRVHLEQAKQVIAAGKPFFVDKPLASTLADAREIAKLAGAAKVPFFSASSLRFSDFVSLLRVGSSITGAVAWSPGHTEPHQQLDLSWYGIHAIETLYALMGRGCQELIRFSSDNADDVTCKWNDGRIGTVRVTRPEGAYGAVVFRANGTQDASPKAPKVDYLPLVREIARFFQTKEAPVSVEEMLEIMEFMDAAQKPGVLRHVGGGQ